PMLDAVIAGHQHVTNDAVAGGVPYVQSKWAGRNFGIIQLVVKKDPQSGRLMVEREKTRKQASIPISPHEGEFMGERVTADSEIAREISAKRTEVKAIADQVIGETTTPFSGDGKRTSDSEIGNLLADMMARAAGTKLAVIGSGDVRVGIS